MMSSVLLERGLSDGRLGCRESGNEVIEFFAHAPSQEDVGAFRLSLTAHERLRELLARNAAGTLTAGEQHELDQMALLDDILLLIRAHAQDTPAVTSRL